MTHDVVRADEPCEGAWRVNGRHARPVCVFEPAGLYTLAEVKRFTGRDIERGLRAITCPVVILADRPPRYWVGDITLALGMADDDTG